MTNVIKGNITRPNAGIKDWYQKELAKLVKRMTDEVMNTLDPLYKELDYQIEFSTDESISSQTRIKLDKLFGKYEKIFKDKGDELSKKVVNKSQTYARTTLLSSLKSMLGEKAKDFTIKTNATSAVTKEVAKALIYENVSLIKTIQSEYFKQITGTVTRSIQTGKGVSFVKKELMKYKGMTERRARNIALDQTRKAFNVLNSRRMQDVGIDYFEWVHTGGSQKPRSYHKNVLNGKICKYSDPPPLNEEKTIHGIPGELPFCHCVARAVLNYDGEYFSGK